MIILAFVDLHGSDSSFKEIIKKSKKADIIICAGDFTIFGSDEKKIIKKLDTLNKKVLLIHGNHEDEQTTRDVCSKSKNVVFIHKRKFEYEGLYFIGWGGGGFSDEEKGFESYLKKWKIEKDDKLILVTHAPPYKTKIDKVYGENAGCKTFRKFIEKYNPILSISGHLHENSKKVDKINSTLVINPGHDGELLEL